MQTKRSVHQRGLYNPQFEHDACGIALLANIDGKKSHTIINQALTALERLDHRGGRGANQQLGDGAGILTQIPHPLFYQEWIKKNIEPLEPGRYGVGMFFLPPQPDAREFCEKMIESVIADKGLSVHGWRTVPTDDRLLQAQARTTQPMIRQVFVQSPFEQPNDIQFERILYQIRRKIEKAWTEANICAEGQYHAVSFSARTIIYKGLLLPEQLREYYLDLQDELYQSAMAMVHNRFSTNTFPSWNRAQPNRYSMHNGEINTINGNINGMFARETAFQSTTLDVEELRPIIDLSGSDSAMFDNVLEFLVLSGWSLPHAMMMMVPEPWQKNRMIDEKKRAFYQFHSALMEPWDGPAALGFTDGIQLGACLDRNGLRPARYVVTEDDFIYVASEVGVVDIPEEKIIRKGRLKPGQMLVIDLQEKKLRFDDEIKQTIISSHPYQDWVQSQIIPLENFPSETDIFSDQASEQTDAERERVDQIQHSFGYTIEEWEKVIKPMALNGSEPIGSMGYDAPLAILSNRPQLLFHYFKQKFAQVTNPPIDAIREELVTSVEVLLGPKGNLLEPSSKNDKNIRLNTPILLDSEIAKLRRLQTSDWRTAMIPTIFPLQQQEGALEQGLRILLQSVDDEVERGSNLFILSDRETGRDFAPIPSLLAVSAVHHHLIQTGQRSKVSIIVESAEPREVHHFACLLGYGADAIYPYLIYQTVDSMLEKQQSDTVPEMSANYVKAVTKGIVKIMSKMGIATIQSYQGAQIFEAIGISQEVIDHYFPRTTSQIGGLRLDDIAKEVRMRHVKAFSENSPSLESGSDFQWRHNGETHLFRPETIHTLQYACRTGKYEVYKKYSRLLQEAGDQQVTLRGQLEFTHKRKSVPLEEVEPVESIFKRFKTGAMSYGSISKEAHEALAVAMNRIGGKSNSGEGGEDPERFQPLPNGDSKRSKIKQVASGRFGVTSHYLINCDEIQIKMAQGAKPGEGGQLAGHKVTIQVAKTRGSTPGIELISPPPHHDIYSIEDLAQLIYDLKNANPNARINVKLVSEAGVGTIAAGVAKAKADVILISGYDGGTGAASKSSIKHTGMPWELGLSETHQTLMMNGLRDRVIVETDGKMMNGRDVVIAALLGAEEFGFSTLPLVSLGCVMMRVCHLDTCPVGIATQNPELRKKMTGTADHIVHLMHFIAQEVREYMAELGFRTMDEMIGQSDMLTISETNHWKAKTLDLMPLLHKVEGIPRFTVKQNHQLENSLDYRELLPMSRTTISDKKSMHAILAIRNTDRSTGTLLGSEISRQYGQDGLPGNAIHLHFKGSAGQSFGAFIPKGMTMKLEGDANDNVGKGLSGGTIIIHPSHKAHFAPANNIIIGNAAFYGATSGEAYIYGMAGERFCVRNSGAQVVVEGIGDHGCEYMTGGRVVVLGEVGKNFAAGMSGGIAYIYRPSGSFSQLCNQEMVIVEAVGDFEELHVVKTMMKRHFHYTKSRTAKKILERWEEESTHFVRVISKEYRQLLTTSSPTFDEQYT
ncbi:glutamate synthase large subunit [Lederbergia sp. NSJ-179]|uniref:glutamate synthase large subunit n=1 Tax=Lederbergia sp. NSJ-179 TaxID=2931402 RepID=UPI001FD21EB5|nr:glutamate synthase large subunit [Lederbergia sp. NSJ-179]MCJ7842050.1 glutamate synthase large subunit [Lederbergia sp. NSJ-179]